MRLRRQAPASPATTPLLAYAARMHAGLPDAHTVCSPLGVWVLVALLADAAEDPVPFEAVLGTDAATAAALARELLGDPHPAVRAAVALWADDPAPALAAVGGGIAETGPVPTQEHADAWARDRTLGLVERFPATIDASVVAVLASALATRVDWASPFGSADPEDVRGPVDPRFAGAQYLLPAEDHWHGIVDARFAAHCASSRDGLVVASVLGAPDDPPAVVLDAAARVASGRATGDLDGVTPLADLPLGDGPAWTLSERRGTGPREQWESVLPAWSAASDHVLTGRDDLGVPAALAVLARLARSDGQREARQAAVARFTATGFEAAAVTAFAVSLSMAVTDRRVRVAQAAFCRPYAVVAATAGDGPWRGVPVFSAWVADPGA